MIAPPRPWTDLRVGGYLERQLELIKRMGHDSATLRILAAADLSSVFTAINALQDSQWRINKDVYNDMRKAWEENRRLPGMPLISLEKARAQTTMSRREADAALAGFHETMRMRLELCEELAEARLYFPSQLDRRGRVYAVPQLLTPQSDDTARALLEFAEGRPLGESGVRWLAIHLANLYGNDKLPFDERLAWVKEHGPEISACAKEPFKTESFWANKTVSKPWRFLAACKEWARYQSEGPHFQSHIPVSVDGTCNGLQHLSAMTRDSVGGKATNLTPGDGRNDIYDEVRVLVEKAIASDAIKGVKGAIVWQGKVTRDIVKGATMTTPYGVTQHGIREQILLELIGSCAEEDVQDRRRSLSYLAAITDECIQRVVVKGRRLMTWLQEIAETLAKRDRGLCWTLPTGFVVIHAEKRRARKRRIVVPGCTLVMREIDKPGRIDVGRQVRGITAHLVHSLDAAHMMLTVIRLHREGVSDFAMVHDSFGVHACHVDRLNRVLREEFVRMYQKPILKEFLAEQRGANPDIPLKSHPRLGTLDIQGVLDSKYFFC